MEGKAIEERISGVELIHEHTNHQDYSHHAENLTMMILKREKSGQLYGNEIGLNITLIFSSQNHDFFVISRILYPWSVKRIYLRIVVPSDYDHQRYFSTGKTFKLGRKFTCSPQEMCRSILCNCSRVLVLSKLSNLDFTSTKHVTNEKSLAILL